MRNALSLENLTGIFRVSPKEPSRIINREGTTIELRNHTIMAIWRNTLRQWQLSLIIREVIFSSVLEINLGVC